jgi:serine/threonine protein kinase
MDPHRWQRLTQLYHAACGRPEADRPAFLRDACGDDDGLREEVESLLTQDRDVGQFLESPPLGRTSPVDERIPESIGRYHVDAKLGAGGMGVVYRGYDAKLERNVAIKVVSGVSHPSSRKQLLREARAASALNHPHICTIHEVDDTGEVAFIAMEYIDGTPLDALIPPRGLPAETVLRYAIQIADALAHAHQKGIVHRDVKAANVLIAQGRAKVLDFGLAKRENAEETIELAPVDPSMTTPRVVKGTLAYMAPEQLRGERATASSDVWALGVLLHEMTTGLQPFAGRTPGEVTSAILSRNRAPLPARVTPAMRAVIARCLEWDPALRYRHAGEVRAALEPAQTAGAAPWRGWGPALTRRVFDALHSLVRRNAVRAFRQT